MPEDIRAWRVRRAANDVIWHIRLAANALEHALEPWGGVAALVHNAPAEVQHERVRFMNIISDLCGQLMRSLAILSGREERFDPAATVARLIECCEIAMADLTVGRLRQVLEDAARDEEAPDGTVAKYSIS
jgi:hypothetical protein